MFEGEKIIWVTVWGQKSKQCAGIIVTGPLELGTVLARTGVIA